MLSVIRRTWKAFLDSLPSGEPERIPDEQIIREYFRPPPVDKKTKATYKKLIELLHAHLEGEMATKHISRAVAKLKPGDLPIEVLDVGLLAGRGKVAASLGFIGLDWKACEEIYWQANLLCKAHGISDEWAYDWQTNSENEGWQERGEVPVEAPLRSFGRWLRGYKVTLAYVGVDDSVLAFAVSDENCATLLELSKSLEIPVKIAN